MDANNQLEPGETLLIMRSGSRGKTIKGTRVFKSWHDFREWAMKNMVSDRCNKPVGEVAWSHSTTRYDYSTRPATVVSVDTTDYVVTQTGIEVYDYTYSLFSAHEDRDPKRIKVTAEMLGYPEAKWEQAK